MNQATVFTDDGAYSLCYEFDNDSVYPIRREHLGLFVRELPADVEDALLKRAYASLHQRGYDEDDRE